MACEGNLRRFGGWVGDPFEDNYNAPSGPWE